MKKIVYVDMDNVLVDFVSGINQLSKEVQIKYKGDLDEVPGIFSLMIPMEGAIDSFKKLSSTYDTYILSTAPWENTSAWSDKLEWVKKYLGFEAHKRLILSHNKNLNRGDYLIDDRTANGADKFQGELIRFGSEKFPNWKSVCDYLLPESPKMLDVGRIV
jgi:5'(3')-deoxyribonucleotidase